MYDLLKVDLLDLSHESGAKLIWHVKARCPLQGIDQYLVFRRLERPHHCKRQTRIVADMTDRLLAYRHVGVGNPFGEYLHRFVTVIAGVVGGTGKPGSEIAYHIGLACDGRSVCGRHHHIGHVVAAADDQERIGDLLKYRRDVGLPRHHRIDLALLEGWCQAELRPDILDGQVLVFHAGAAQYHLEIFVRRLPPREPDPLALEVRDFADIDAATLAGDDSERLVGVVAGGVVHNDADHLEWLAGMDRL